jgi:hypothetical protein
MNLTSLTIEGCALTDTDLGFHVVLVTEPQ